MQDWQQLLYHCYQAYLTNKHHVHAGRCFLRQAMTAKMLQLMAVTMHRLQLITTLSQAPPGCPWPADGLQGARQPQS